MYPLLCRPVIGYGEIYSRPVWIEKVRIPISSAIVVKNSSIYYLRWVEYYRERDTRQHTFRIGRVKSDNGTAITKWLKGNASIPGRTIGVNYICLVAEFKRIRWQRKKVKAYYHRLSDHILNELWVRHIYAVVCFQRHKETK